MATVTERLAAALKDRYRIERELGQGGMATVYLARDLKHERRVALKVLHPELAAVLGEERFLGEIRTTAHLQHPNILQLFDSGSADGLLYYVMPYVEGESLRGRLEREKLLPIDDAIAIARGVAAALDFAHRRGVVHRDIKPENILLQDGQPVVADFGIALAITQAADARLTQTGLSLGTPQYMSPEQATGEKTIDARADVYALGAVTYEMLAGEPPYTGSTSQAILARVLTEKPRAVQASRPNVPPHLALAVERALEKLPADRFASARDFAAALERSPSISAAMEAQIAANTRIVPAEAAPRRVLLPWLAVIVLAAAAAWGWFRPRAPEPTIGRARFAIVLPDSAQLREDVTGANIALSPDGTQLVYVGGLVTRRLYVRNLDDLEPRPIAGTEGAITPRFSPDGRWLAFTIGRQLKKVPLSGGSPVPIADGVARYSWGDQDVIVFSRASGGLRRVRGGGGPVQDVTQLDSTRNEGAHSWPEVLPGNDVVLFTVHVDSGDVAVNQNPELAAVRLRDGQVVRLGVHGTNPRYAAGHILFGQPEDGSVAAVPFDPRQLRVTGPVIRVLEGVVVKGGGAVEIAISPNGTLAYVEVTGSELVRVDRTGSVRPVLTGRGRFSSPRFSPAGDRIALGIREIGGTSDVWVYTPSSETLTRLTNDGKSTSQSWLPDGRSIAWVILDKVRLMKRQAWDGSGTADTLVGPEQDFRSLSLSREGNVFASATPTGLWLADLTRPSQGRVAVDVRGQSQPELSPDGKWLAYRSGGDVYVTSVANGGRHQISTDGGAEPAWSRDSRELFYRADGRFMAATISTESGFAILRRTPLFTDVYLRGIERTNYDVASDGKEFLLVRRSDRQQRALVVFGWLNELRERMRQAAAN